MDGQAAAAGLPDRVSTPSGPALELGERVKGARFDRAEAVGTVGGPGRAAAGGRAGGEPMMFLLRTKLPAGGSGTARRGPREGFPGLAAATCESAVTRCGGYDS